MPCILATLTSHLPITPVSPQFHTNHSYIHIYSFWFVSSGFISKYTTKDSECLSQNLILVNNFNAKHSILQTPSPSLADSWKKWRCVGWVPVTTVGVNWWGSRWLESRKWCFVAHHSIFWPLYTSHSVFPAIPCATERSSLSDFFRAEPDIYIDILGSHDSLHLPLLSMRKYFCD